MKSYQIFIALIIFPLVFGACKKFNDAADAEKIGNYSVKVTAPSAVSTITSTEGLKIVFENIAEGLKIERKLSGNTSLIEGLIPGIYRINISGRVEDSEGTVFYLSGSKNNYAIIKNGEEIEIPVSGLKVSPLIFSEIFYAGTGPSPVPNTGNYFRNQFYEVYNNSDKLIYLDGLYFASLTPQAATANLPVWPAEDGTNYAYADRVWKIPGSGTQYPLEPGESFVMSQFAVNHKLPQYNVNSPIDCTTSEFEFNTGNANFPDQPAVNMQHVFYNGSASFGTLPQYLTPVGGGAYAIFKVPEGDVYDPVNNPGLKTKNLIGNATLYAKIPVTYMLDVVEAGPNQNSITLKRVASVLDAGMTYVGLNYNSLGVARKVAATNDDGSAILMDTNNSTDDFERGVMPQFRRYGAKMPSWNHSR